MHHNQGMTKSGLDRLVARAAISAAIGLIGASALAAAAYGSTSAADKPDLVPRLPSAPYAHQVAPVYVDTF